MDYLTMVIIFGSFWALIHFGQERLEEEHEDNSVKVQDFTVKLDNLPFDDEFGGNQHILKAYIWRKVNDLIVNSFREEYGRDPLPEEKRTEIVDVQVVNLEFRALQKKIEYGKILKKRQIAEEKLHMIQFLKRNPSGTS